jgi:hypothetical protein
VSRIVPCGRTGGETDITKLIAAFRGFVNAPKKTLNSVLKCTSYTRLKYQTKPEAHLLIVSAPCNGCTGFTTLGEGEVVCLSETSVYSD